MKTTDDTFHIRTPADLGAWIRKLAAGRRCKPSHIIREILFGQFDKRHAK